MGTHWEQTQKKNSTNKPPLPPPKTRKVKNYATLSLLIGCMEFLFPKRVGHHFQPGLIPPLYTGGHLLLLSII